MIEEAIVQGRYYRADCLLPLSDLLGSTTLPGGQLTAISADYARRTLVFR